MSLPSFLFILWTFEANFLVNGFLIEKKQCILSEKNKKKKTLNLTQLKPNLAKVEVQVQVKVEIKVIKLNQTNIN